MTTKIEITLPDEIAHYEAEFRYFVDSMVRKLHTNRHKGFVQGLDFDACVSGIQGEVAELETSKSQFEAFMEAVDIANWGFLTAVFLGRMTRPEFDQIGLDKKPERREPHYPFNVNLDGWHDFQMNNGRVVSVNLGTLEVQW